MAKAQNKSTAQPGTQPVNKLQPGADWYDDPHTALDVVDARLSSLQTLLVTEDKIRRAKTENELQHLITNETRKILGARQIFLLRKRNRGGFSVVCVSSMAITERDTPLIRWVENLVERLPEEEGGAKAVDFELPGFADEAAEETKRYPFRYLCWQPLKLNDGTVFAGLLLARNSPWNSSSIETLEREADFYAHAWMALKQPEKLRPKPASSREIKLAIILSTFLLLCAPFPLTTLAPVEIVAKDPFIVAAPIDGVVDKILIEPNHPVRAGEPILNFEDTRFRNRLEISEREMRVAEATYRRAAQAAFYDEGARHELAIARAEFELKKSEYEYAAEELSRTVIKAPRAGLAIFPNKDEWKGRPVVTGEQIMRIAEPKKVSVELNLPVADAIVIKEGALVRIFLDADPLSAVKARVDATSYHAVPTDGDTLAYKLRAKLEGDIDKLPRIGSRGTAQIFGDTVPLGFYLFRRPISWLRQHLGV